MIWRPVALFVSATLLFTFGYFQLKTPRSPEHAKAPSQLSTEHTDQALGSKPDELPAEEDKYQPLSATPEDKSLYTRLIGPLSVWMKEAEKKAHKEKPEEVAAPALTARETLPADHVDITPAPAAKHFLHRRFTVKQASAVAFLVPAHQMNPQLRGSFRTIVPDGGSGPGTSKVILLLLNREEYDDFLQHRPGSATFGADPSSRQNISYPLPPTHDDPQEYHLVFRNDNSTAAMVEADFTVTFE